MNPKQIDSFDLHLCGITTIIAALVILIVAYIGFYSVITRMLCFAMNAWFILVPQVLCSVFDKALAKYYLLYYSIATSIVGVAFGLIDPFIGPVMVVIINLFIIVPMWIKYIDGN